MFRVISHVRSERGLHARPSAAVVKEAIKYEALIQIVYPKKDLTVNAKSILQVMLLAALQGEELLVEAIGSDAEEAAKNVAKIIDEFYIRGEES